MMSICCVEAGSQLKLVPTSILDIYKVFERIDMLYIGIHQQPYTVVPILDGSDFGVLSHLWSQMMSTHCGLAFFPLLPMHLASQLKRRISSSAHA